MNRKELIDALASKTGSSKADADRSIAALIDVITATL
jgi:DNA-binding protein HU-beta